MVRLKANSSAYTLRDRVISIPYGAIKSGVVTDSNNKVSRISIPYGAIKSL